MYYNLFVLNVLKRNDFGTLIKDLVKRVTGVNHNFMYSVITV